MRRRIDARDLQCGSRPDRQHWPTTSQVGLVRALVCVRGGEATLVSHNGNDLTKR